MGRAVGEGGCALSAEKRVRPILPARTLLAIDLAFVWQWAPSSALYRLHSEFGHYFRREPPGRWHFFHNSFRVFLLKRTQRLSGVSSVAGDAGLYLRLAGGSIAGDAR